MSQSPVSISISDDQSRVAFRLFHPKGNIITVEMVHALRAALETLPENPHLKLATIEGEGGDFSYGASIAEHTPDEIGRALPAMRGLIDDLLSMPVPTAAIVRGRCLGGGFELALACDLIFAADDAVFGLPEIDLGVFPPIAAALLPLRVGAARATRAMLTGEALTAAACCEAGLVELVAPGAQLGREVDAWFNRHFALKSAAALRHAAVAARLGLVAQTRATLPELERLYLDDLMHTHDAVEGVDAFLGKRPPTWKNR
jgi:cyclohexa-1,5-dienecarbonyl-CoA hydratase